VCWGGAGGSVFLHGTPGKTVEAGRHVVQAGAEREPRCSPLHTNTHQHTPTPRPGRLLYAPDQGSTKSPFPDGLGSEFTHGEGGWGGVLSTPPSLLWCGGILTERPPLGGTDSMTIVRTRIDQNFGNLVSFMRNFRLITVGRFDYIRVYHFT